MSCPVGSSLCLALYFSSIKEEKLLILSLLNIQASDSSFRHDEFSSVDYKICITILRPATIQSKGSFCSRLESLWRESWIR